MKSIDHAKKALLKETIYTETKSGPISINQLHVITKIHRDTISNYVKKGYLGDDVLVLREQNLRGREGAKIISKDNYHAVRTTEDFLDLFMKLDLNTKLKVVEGFNQLIRQRFQELDEMFETVDTPDKVIVRYRQTGKTAFIVHLRSIRDTGKKVLIRVPKTECAKKKG